MSWRAEWSRPAQHDMRRLAHEDARRVREVVLRLAESNTGNTQKLRGRGDEWRLRIGDYRVLFHRDHAARTVIVLHVLPRGRAYRA